MPAKKTTADTPLHVALLDGFEVKSRPNGTVHTIRAGKTVVAEVCVGARAVRLNLRAPVKSAPKGLKLVGKSKTWAGGGVVVTPENLAAARAALTAATAAPKQAKAA